MGKSILLIDGDEGEAKNLGESIARLHYRIDYVNSQQEAVRLGQGSRYDLIIIDPSVDHNSGLNAIEAIRSVGASREIPILVESKSKTVEAVKAAMNAGASDYLLKPYTKGVLVHKICRWINSEVEKQWEQLPPRQSKTLKSTMTALDSAFNGVVEGNVEKVDYAGFHHAADNIGNIIESGEVMPVLDALKEHDSYTFVHSMRMAIFLTMFAETVGSFSEREIKLLTTGGIMHDIGKAKVPGAILNKPGKFTDEEFIQMKRHVEYTVDLLYDVPGIDEEVMEIAWSHHEKLDGSGYPRGLRGEQINELARMSSIVDIYTALNDRRVYKDPIEPAKCIEIMKGMDTHLDMILLEAFIVSLEKAGILA